MCGIVGVVSAAVRGDDPQLLATMRDRLIHRGPDDQGEWWSVDRVVGLGHRRLAVVDLSPAGHQPMVAQAGDVVIVFNGEIYNFRELRQQLCDHGHTFRSSGDTEVILNAFCEWGISCIDRLNGMFALAIYDQAARRLYLARDRAGEKPLFYTQQGGVFAFASELKALLVHPGLERSIDSQALDSYLAYGYVPRDRCILKGYYKLPQGHALTLDVASGDVRVHAYWQLPAPAAEESRSDEELVDDLERLLADAVKRQLVADVPVGVLLSGGIDSSLVTAMAVRTSTTPVKTFTVSFPGYGSYDEAPFARIVAEHFGTEHHELQAERATPDILALLARQYDEPLADSSMVPTYLVSRMIRQYATVALGGDGGDELFAGYPHYQWLAQQRRLQRWVPTPALAAGAEVARMLPPGVRGRNYLLGLASTGAGQVANVNQYFDGWSRSVLLGDAVIARRTVAESDRAALVLASASPLQQATRVDFQTSLVDAYLVKVDRASMLSSLEVRAPFLDHRIIEFAFGCVPDRLRANTTELKILPRRLARRLLPDTLDLTRKQGFSIPLDEWLKGEWGTRFREVLLDPAATTFDRGFVTRLFKKQQEGYSNSQRLYALTMFELWRAEYAV